MQLNPALQRLIELGKRATRPIVRKGWWHWVRFALLLAAGSYLGHMLSESPQLAGLRYSIYQKQVQLQHREVVYPQHTVLVLIDDDDYWSDEFQARSPYKRDQLAYLLDRLNEAGANIVAFDIDWSSPLPDKPDYEFSDYTHEDDIFFSAVKRMCDAGRHVVLTNGVEGEEKPPFRKVPTIYWARLQFLPCVSVGHDRIPLDMRQISGMLPLATGGYLDSLSLAIVKITDPVAYANLVKNEDRGFRFGRYLTPADYQPKNGMSFVLHGHSIHGMDTNSLRQAVAQRVVIVGGDYSSFAYGHGDHVDIHDSPGGPEPGVMLHANYVEAELNQDGTFTPISDRNAECVEWVLAFGLALVGALEVQSFWKWSSVGICFAFSLLLTYVLMQNLGLFLDFFVPFLMIVVHTFTEELLEIRHELKHAKHKLKEANS